MQGLPYLTGYAVFNVFKSFQRLHLPASPLKELRQLRQFNTYIFRRKFQKYRSVNAIFTHVEVIAT